MLQVKDDLKVKWKCIMIDQRICIEWTVKRVERELIEDILHTQ